MEDTELLVGQGGRYVVLASGDMTQFDHGREPVIVDR
jgi:hypothetical protein